MKKWFIILAMLLMFLLTACARESTVSTTLPTDHTTATTNPDEPPRPEPTAPTEPAPPANVGDILDVADAAATLEAVAENEIFRVEIIDAYYDHFIYAWEYSFATDTSVVYIYDEYEGEEIVNVVKRDNATRYFRLIGQESFVLDSEADEFDWMEDKDVFTSMMQTLTQYSQPTEGIRYRKREDITATAGDACAYEIFDNGVLSGYLYIDKNTGILSALADENGNIIALITAISTEDAGIPDYK